MNTLPALDKFVLNNGQLLRPLFEMDFQPNHPAHELMPICCPVCGSRVIAYVQPALHASQSDRLVTNCMGYPCVGASTLPVADWLDAVLPVHAGVDAKGAA